MDYSYSGIDKMSIIPPNQVQYFWIRYFRKPLYIGWLSMFDLKVNHTYDFKLCRSLRNFFLGGSTMVSYPVDPGLTSHITYGLVANQILPLKKNQPKWKRNKVIEDIEKQKKQGQSAVNLIVNADHPEQSFFEHLESPNACFQCRLFHLRDEGGHIIAALDGPTKKKMKFLKFDFQEKEFKLMGQVKNMPLRYKESPYIDIPMKWLARKNLHECNEFTLTWWENG